MSVNSSNNDGEGPAPLANQSDERGWTPLVVAARGGHEDVIRLLLSLEPRGSVDGADDDGETPLMAAAMAGHDHIVELLCELGARPELVDHQQRTALHYALLGGHASTARRLKDAGANLEMTATTFGVLVAAAGIHRDALLDFLEDPESLADLRSQSMIAVFEDAETAEEIVARLAEIGEKSMDFTTLPTGHPDGLTEAEAAAQQCVVLKPGAPTFAYIPLSRAEPMILSLLAAAAEGGGFADFEQYELENSRMAQLPFAPDVGLILVPHRTEPIEAPFVVHDGKLRLASATNEWLYQLMESRMASQTPETLISYVLFLLVAVVGQLGAFRPVTQSSQIPWLEAAPAEKKQQVADVLQPLAYIGRSEDGRHELRGTVLFKNALFLTSVMISENSEVELANEEPIIEELPVSVGRKTDLLVVF
jgi:hypothetical protein